MKELWCENCWSGVQGHDTKSCPHSTAKMSRVNRDRRNQLIRQREEIAKEIAEVDALLERLKR